MVAEAFAALGAIKSASETAKALIELRDVSLVQSKAIELQRHILEAQEAALLARERESTLFARIRELEEEVAGLKAWDAKAKDYEFKQVATGAFAYPWRGRITCDPAPGLEATADKTEAAATQVAAFCGAAMPGQFSHNANGVIYSGPGGDWGFRRFVLHHARLALAAGGVEAFLLGSEMRGVSTLRDGEGSFPFVGALATLAAEVKAMLGAGTTVTYGADWSEYFGHQPADGTGDVFFHLDTLWAHPAIGAVGIDNYMPLADWCDADYAGGNPDGAAGPHDMAALGSCIASGEGFDWYYANSAARSARERTPITDGTYRKDWVFRPKDLVSWWSNAHYDRPGGVEAEEPTAWVARSKPIFFTEIGCPAVDKGPSQPNAFPDPKSSEDSIPHFSNGGRSDAAQRGFLAAHFAHWDASSTTFTEGNNPLSPHYDGRMVDPSRLYLWAWDARPFPAYPQRRDLWADGAAWQTGHWLNGRLSGVAIGDLVTEIVTAAGLPAPDVAKVAATAHGYVIEEPASARAVLEPLVDLFGLSVIERDGRLAFASAGDGFDAPVAVNEMVVPERGETLLRMRAPADMLPGEAELGFRDPFADHQAAIARAWRPGAGGGRVSLGFSGTLERGAADALLADWLRREWAGRETLRFKVPPTATEIAPGTIIEPAGHGGRRFRVASVEQGLVREVAAFAVEPVPPTPWRDGVAAIGAPPSIAGPPLAIFLDLPMGPAGGTPEERFVVAARARPWRSQAVLASPESSGFAERATITRPAAIGRLATSLLPGASGRPHVGSRVDVDLFEGELSSATRSQLLNGANAAAIRSQAGAWEIVQFERAEEIAPSLWRLEGLLRGQLGTEDAAVVGANEGADFVLIDEALTFAGLQQAEAGLSLTWLVGPVGDDLAGGNFVEAIEIGGLRARRPLTPVHLRAAKSGTGDVTVRWVRRGRLDADSWEGDDIPLGEEQEHYRIEVLDEVGVVLRTADSTVPNWTYPVANIVHDFGSVPDALDIRVRQMGSGAGLPARRILAIN
jgi:hypothetical protein